MSNEEVVLKMLVNRLEQLLEAHEDLRKWSAEITEIIHLGKGVLIEAPEPRVGQPVAAMSRDPYSGEWMLPLSDEMVDRLYNSTAFDDWSRTLRNEIEDRIATLYDLVFPGSTYDEDDNEIVPEPLNVAPARINIDEAAIERLRASLREANLGLTQTNPGDAAHVHPTVGGEEQ
jgi:hypothetical protein